MQRISAQKYKKRETFEPTNLSCKVETVGLYLSPSIWTSKKQLRPDGIQAAECHTQRKTQFGRSPDNLLPGNYRCLDAEYVIAADNKDGSRTFFSIKSKYNEGGSEPFHSLPPFHQNPARPGWRPCQRLPARQRLHGRLPYSGMDPTNKSARFRTTRYWSPCAPTHRHGQSYHRAARRCCHSR